MRRHHIFLGTRQAHSLYILDDLFGNWAGDDIDEPFNQQIATLLFELVASGTHIFFLANPTLIHGHTHRPAQHTHQVDGHACTRHVLADWHDHPTWLRFDGTGFMPCTLPRP
ncbi:hypothetical protein AGMMS50225_03000 [Betaproteobacteria bacterium]|nr:hypothetical protein AGMMS50225_03000 [Betaproteobacteria bacterium]